MAAGATSLSPGAVFGRYILIDKLGHGAMGEVWVALDPDLDRKIALKLLRTDRLARPEDRARLDSEARAMARLAHPNVATVHDVGVVGGQLFIAMELVEGQPLDAWIAAGDHPWTEAVAILRQAAAGLAAAHDAGLVHRDFKPANVMIGRDGRVRVLDFGLARPEDSGPSLLRASVPREGSERVAEGDESETRTQALTSGRRGQGSPAYMAPEQHRGGLVDARSDLFAFCVTLFEALYGVRPFRAGNRLAVSLAIVEGRMTEPPAEARARVPDWIHAIVVRGLANDPAQRYPDMRALLAALERSPEQRRRRRWQLAGVVGMAAGAIGLGLALRPKPPEDLCAAVGAELDDPGARQRLRARVDAVTNAPPLAGARLAEGLERRAVAWAEASELLCRDRQAQRLTPRLEAAREACLREHRAAAELVLGLAGDQADPELVTAVARQPLATLRTLGDPGHCADRPAATDAPVIDDAQRRVRAELRLRLAVLPSSAEAVAGELARGSGPDDDESRLLQARLRAAAGDHDAAEAQLHAIARAATAEAPAQAAAAWLELVGVALARVDARAAELDARERGQVIARGFELLDYADALLPAWDRAGRARLGLLAGRLALLDTAAEAPAPLDAAIAQLRAQPSDEVDLLAALLELRAELHGRQGRVQVAADLRREAELLLADALGG